MQQSERGNRLVSPFNINQVVAIPVPTRKVCMKPLREYARCAMSRKVQIDESIFDDILSRTRRFVISPPQVCFYIFKKNIITKFPIVLSSGTLGYSHGAGGSYPY